MIILPVGVFLMVVVYLTLSTVVSILTAFSGTLPEMVRAIHSKKQCAFGERFKANLSKFIVMPC